MAPRLSLTKMQVLLRQIKADCMDYRLELSDNAVSLKRELAVAEVHATQLLSTLAFAELCARQIKGADHGL